MPTVQTGSMADIAFLLLIFFLVATKVPNDNGLARKLPPECKNPPCNTTINDRNVLEIILNKKDEILVEEKIVDINELKNLVVAFVDNNGDGTCNYCNGLSLANSSVNPNEAVISLITDRASSYEQFIKIQNELTNAFKELRTVYCKNAFNKNIENLSKKELDEAKLAYPFRVSEAEINK